MSTETLHGLAVSQVSETRWHVHRLDGVKPMAGPPVVVLDREGDGYRISREGHPMSTHVVGDLDFVVGKLAAGLRQIGFDEKHGETMVAFFEALLRICNVLACKQGQTPAFLLALAKTFADVLLDDIKPGGQAEVVMFFNGAVQARLKSRRAVTEGLDAAMASLVEALSALKPDDDDKPEAEVSHAKH